MKGSLSIILILTAAGAAAQAAATDTLRLTLAETIRIAQVRSVDAAVALNRLKTAYWEYRTHRADQLPEVSLAGTLPSYNNNYGRYQQPDGSYTYVQNNWMGLSGTISITQNLPLTGGRVALSSSLDFTRQLGRGAYNEFMSIPFGLTFTQPVFGVNSMKWKRRIEPVKYREAQAAFIEDTEAVTLAAIAHFFGLLQARENLRAALRNNDNAEKLHNIAVAKRAIGYISEGELMQLELSALQARGLVTEAQSNLNAAAFSLRSFLDIEASAVEAVIPEAAPAISVSYNEVLGKAQLNNSFAHNIMRRRLEADFAVAAARGERRSVNLYASAGYTGKDMAAPAAYRNLRSNQSVEVGLVIPILDWGKRKGKVKTAESNREVVISKTRQEQMMFEQDIYLLTENFNNQASQLRIAAEADRIAERRYETAVETFMIGQISALYLNDARKSKDEARLKHIAELHKYWSYFYNIRSITLYDFIANRNLDADFESLARE
jgi:outer membrane protein TolC